jgi:hypothetical protein
MSIAANRSDAVSQFRFRTVTAAEGIGFGRFCW